MKEELRKSILQKRLDLSPAFIHEQSQKIQKAVLNLPLWVQSQKIGLYSAVKNEVETMLLFMTGLEQGKNIYFPRVEQGLHFYEVLGPEDMQKGAWAILEPKQHCEPLGEEEKLDLVIVPGVVFDKSRNRIGYGKGFYDGVLKQFLETSIALAYDFQVVEEIKADSWDVKVKKIITDVREL
ncbi:MAG: hypothetical protein ACD_73C00447G0001 [uncultured bacterium]|nr:MAG: hypothetical protein ACD_73C00447G0001 [uncultured bacterium]